MTKKRNLPAFLLALVLVLFTGCQKESVVYLELPFAADDVESVTAVYRENPSDAGQEKIVTERSAVRSCMNALPRFLCGAARRSSRTMRRSLHFPLSCPTGRSMSFCMPA